MKSPMHLAGLSVAVLLAGCATFSPDGGFGTVESTVTDRGLKQAIRWIRNDEDAKQVQASLKKLLGTPLAADSAVQIALLNNRGLQATYAELGIAEADLVQAGRLRNPGFVFERLQRGDVVEIERTFLFDILGLITMPVRTDIERRRFAAAQDRVAVETLQVAADARRAWVSAVAEQEAAKYMEQVQAAAEASAELARRMTAAGNLSKLDQAREQVFYADATAQLARTRQGAVAARERLTRLMGLWGGDIAFKLPDRLPALPDAALDVADLEAQALEQRLDVRRAMKEAESVAALLGLTKATGYVSVLEVGYRHNSATGEERRTGYEIELRLPVFDWGGAATTRAEHTYMQAVNRAADVAVQARSEVREAYFAYRTAFDLARHYRDEIVPLRKRMSEENLLRYNGMLISLFELLADARQQILTVNASIEALRDFWTAEANLHMAMTGKSPSAMGRGGGVQATPGNSSAAGH
jgi:outer membrane protein TolC